jgi:hypothetical protein
MLEARKAAKAGDHEAARKLRVRAIEMANAEVDALEQEQAAVPAAAPAPAPAVWDFNAPPPGLDLSNRVALNRWVDAAAGLPVPPADEAA